MPSRRAGATLANLVRQSRRLREDFGEGGSIRHGTLIWSGKVQPTPFSRVYRLGIELGAEGLKVRVHPRLKAPEGADLPHVYPGDELCLFLAGEWGPQDAISDTIVAWASEWLMYYEFWLITGEWHGGGHPYARRR